MPASADAALTPLFTRYQITVIAMLAFLQFAVIIDFMLMAPLGTLIMPALNATSARASADHLPGDRHRDDLHRSDGGQGHRCLWTTAHLPCRHGDHDGDGADLHEPGPLVAGHRGAHQRGAVRRHLLADDPLPGIDDAGAGDHPPRFVQCGFSVAVAACRWCCSRSLRLHRAAGSGWAAAALRCGGIRRGCYRSAGCDPDVADRPRRAWRRG